MLSELARGERILNASVSVGEIIAYLQEDHFMSKTSAAKFIDHADKRIIEQGIREGHLRAFKVGKKVLVRKSDLIAWIERHEVTREGKQAARTDLQNLVSLAIEKAHARTRA